MNIIDKPHKAAQSLKNKNYSRRLISKIGTFLS